MSQFDDIYENVLDIKEKGIWSKGMLELNIQMEHLHIMCLIGYQFRLDNLTDEAHLITTRFKIN